MKKLILISIINILLLLFTSCNVENPVNTEPNIEGQWVASRIDSVKYKNDSLAIGHSKFDVSFKSDKTFTHKYFRYFGPNKVYDDSLSGTYTFTTLNELELSYKEPISDTIYNYIELNEAWKILN